MGTCYRLVVTKARRESSGILRLPSNPARDVHAVTQDKEMAGTLSPSVPPVLSKAEVEEGQHPLNLCSSPEEGFCKETEACGKITG